jgi:hypothetical protein
MLQRWLAACFAALLAVGSFVRPSVPVVLAGAPLASPDAVVAHDHAPDKKPAAGMQPAQPFTPGILSRLVLVETMLGLPPVKSPLLRPVGDQPALALQTTTALGGEPRAVLQRSSVGTARTPTGPPA